MVSKVQYAVLYQRLVPTLVLSTMEFLVSETKIQVGKGRERKCKMHVIFFVTKMAIAMPSICCVVRDWLKNSQPATSTRTVFAWPSSCTSTIPRMGANVGRVVVVVKVSKYEVEFSEITVPRPNEVHQLCRASANLTW